MPAMKHRHIVAALIGAALVASASDHVTEGHVAVNHGLTLAGARRVLAAAEAYAKQNGAPGGAMAVVDAGGHLLAFARLDGTFIGSPEISIGKARTAVHFKKPTKDFEEIIAKGRFAMTTLPDFTPLQGGLPVVHDGHVIGGIGVSGAKSAAQDEEIAQAGAAVIGETTGASK